MKLSAAVVAFVGVVFLAACGPNKTAARYSYYQTGYERVRGVVEAAFAAQDYSYQVVGDGAEFRDYRVGPIWYDADKNRLPGEPAAPVPDGTYAVVMIFEVAGNARNGYYVHVQPSAKQYRGGRAEEHRRVLPMGEHPSGAYTDPLAHDSLYAAAADPVFEAVYAELKDVASNRPSE